MAYIQHHNIKVGSLYVWHVFSIFCNVLLPYIKKYFSATLICKPYNNNNDCHMIQRCRKIVLCEAEVKRLLKRDNNERTE